MKEIHHKQRGATLLTFYLLKTKKGQKVKNMVFLCDTLTHLYITGSITLYPKLSDRKWKTEEKVDNKAGNSQEIAHSSAPLWGSTQTIQSSIVRWHKTMMVQTFIKIRRLSELTTLGRHGHVCYAYKVCCWDIPALGSWQAIGSLGS